jgi:hypothetical protein
MRIAHKQRTSATVKQKQADSVVDVTNLHIGDHGDALYHIEDGFLLVRQHLTMSTEPTAYGKLKISGGEVEVTYLSLDSSDSTRGRRGDILILGGSLIVENFHLLGSRLEEKSSTCSVGSSASHQSHIVIDGGHLQLNGLVEVDMLDGVLLRNGTLTFRHLYDVTMLGNHSHIRMGLGGLIRYYDLDCDGNDCPCDSSGQTNQNLIDMFYNIVNATLLPEVEFSHVIQARCAMTSS